MVRLEDLPPIAFGAMRTIAIPGGSEIDPLSATRDKFVALMSPAPAVESPPDESANSEGDGHDAVSDG